MVKFSFHFITLCRNALTGFESFGQNIKSASIHPPYLKLLHLDDEEEEQDTACFVFETTQNVSFFSLSFFAVNVKQVMRQIHCKLQYMF